MEESSENSNMHIDLLTSSNKETKTIYNSFSSSLNITSLSTKNLLNTKSKIKSLLEIKKYIFRKLINIYKNDSFNYNIKQIEQIISNEDTHLVSIYKDLLIFNDEKEFLKHYYNYYVGRFYLIDLFAYYNEYSIIFPNYIILPERKYIYKNIKKKQKLIDLQQQLNDLDEEKIDGKVSKNDNETFFTNNALNSILNKTNTSHLKKLFGIQMKEEDENNDTPHNILNKLINSEKRDFIKVDNLSQVRNNYKSIIDINSNNNFSKKNKNKLNKLILLKKSNISNLEMKEEAITDRNCKKHFFENNKNRCIDINFYNKSILKANILKKKITILNILNSAKQIRNSKYILNLKDINYSFKIIPNKKKRSKINTYVFDNYHIQNKQNIAIQKQKLINGILLKNQINSKVLDKNSNNLHLNIIKAILKRKIKSKINSNKIVTKKSPKPIMSSNKMKISKIKNINNINVNTSTKSPFSISLKSIGNSKLYNLKNLYTSYSRQHILKTSKKFLHCPTSFNNLSKNKTRYYSIIAKKNKKNYNSEKFNKFQNYNSVFNKNDISIYIQIINDNKISNNNENNKKVLNNKIKILLPKRQLSFININNICQDKESFLLNSDRKIKYKQIVEKQGLRLKGNLKQCPTSRENPNSNKIMREINKFEVNTRRIKIRENKIKEKYKKRELTYYNNCKILKTKSPKSKISKLK